MTTHKSFITQKDINKLKRDGRISFIDGDCEVILEFSDFEYKKED